MIDFYPTIALAGSLWQILKETSIFSGFVLATLVVMSVVSWMIIFRKYREFRAVDGDTQSFTQYFRRARRLDEIAGQAQTYRNSPLAAIYSSGLGELTSLKERKNEAGGLRETTVPLDNDDFELVEMAMERSINDELSRLEKQVIFLATTGSSAPFLGLLGTVVGIMNSFWAIGESGSASLIVVAPGIAEALLATIVGLGAAIPAVIAFNWASNRTKRIQNVAHSFILEFLSRARKEAA
ncbi:MAG: Tol-Pal system subunit TolQ [Candidatus Zixiibacteriota bacterium]|nr:MAG: Tol-Pal system subunit TolQ [candidate division Zixibacteria bacterium]